MLQEFCRIAKDLVYENRCGVCKSLTPNNKIVCNLCDPQKTLLSHSKLLNPPFCLKCGESIQEEESSEICESCNLYPLPTRFIRSIWSYTDTAESLICAYKYGNSRSIASYLATTCTAAILSGIYPLEARYNWDLIIPLPSTNDSLKKRGFSPVAEIVKMLSISLKLPASLLSLETVGNHPPQASLSPADRLKHIKRKYRASSSRVSGKRILLIDDVITSGASLIGSSLALLESGAISVDCLSVCRSDLFAQLRSQIYTKIRCK